MITYVLGDIFTSPATVLVNTVNTVGVMGKGIAKDFKAYFPEMFKQYQELCESEELGIGKLFYYRGAHKSVLNFPTKRHWREKSSTSHIEAGLATFIEKYEDYSIKSIAFPQLGCGNGDLDWESQVRPLMEDYLGGLPIKIYIHLYNGRREFLEHRDVAQMKTWLRSEPESLPFTEVWDDIVGSIVDRSGQPLTGQWAARLVDQEEGAALLFEEGDEQVLLSTDDIRDVWHQLRSLGFFAILNMPDHVSPAGEPLLSLLSTLDYVKPAEFSSSPLPGSHAGDIFHPDFTHGITLVPRSGGNTSANQLELVGFA